MLAASPKPAAGPDANFGYLFRLAHQRFRARLDTALEPFGLSARLYGTLSVFDRHAELSSAELARMAAVSPPSMHATTQQLIEAGLLGRAAHPGHGRIILLRLTTKGRHTLNTATQAVRAIEAQTLARLSSAEQQTVRRWLADIARDP
jgi:DNA-binding MarR family transcriptional regulator